MTFIPTDEPGAQSALGAWLIATSALTVDAGFVTATAPPRLS